MLSWVDPLNVGTTFTTAAISQHFAVRRMDQPTTWGLTVRDRYLNNIHNHEPNCRVLFASLSTRLRFDESDGEGGVPCGWMASQWFHSALNLRFHTSTLVCYI